MKLWKTLRDLNSGDATPGWTKFMTFYIMPLFIIGCGYGYWYFGKILNSTLSDFSTVTTNLTEIWLDERSNNKEIETIYTDLYLTTIEGLKLQKKDIGDHSVFMIKSITKDERVELFYDHQNGIIKEMRLNDEPIISFQAELESHRRGRIMLLLFFFGFLLWYGFRMYRYRKYGMI